MISNTLTGIVKIIASVAVLATAFNADGADKGISIWLGIVCFLPLFLWGLLDLVKNKKSKEDDNDENK